MFGAFFAAFVWWLASLLFPALSFSSVSSSFFNNEKDGVKKDWLPSPKNYAGLLPSQKIQNEYTNVYVPSAPYNGWGDTSSSGYTYPTVGYVVYTSTGTVVVTPDGTDISPSYYVASYVPESTQYQAQVTTQGQQTTSNKPSPQSTMSHRSLYIRNLSIYEGGHVYTGLSFIGEARETMFRDGKFPIVVVDGNNKVVGVSTAVATTKWSVPGWVRFETKISYVLPQNVPCIMVFEEAQTDIESRERPPTRVPVPVKCN
jgi:hypothetical protein